MALLPIKKLSLLKAENINQQYRIIEIFAVILSACVI